MSAGLFDCKPCDATRKLTCEAGHLPAIYQLCQGPGLTQRWSLGKEVQPIITPQ